MKRIMFAFALLALTAPAAQAQVDPSHLTGMQARSIGPAGMSGRVASIDAVVADPRTVYVGSATGGVWKSVDGGLTWTPVFDEQGTASIGAVARHLQERGRRTHLDAPGTGAIGAHPPGGTASHEPGHRLPRCVGAHLVRRRRARRLQDHRRRRNVAARAVREPAYRRRRSGDGPLQSQQAVRGDVGAPTLALVLRVGGTGQRPVRHVQRR